MGERGPKRGRGRSSDDSDDETERRLEAMVFGDERVMVDKLLAQNIGKDSSEDEVRLLLFSFVTVSRRRYSLQEQEDRPGDIGLVRKPGRRPVWVDEDDERET